MGENIVPAVKPTTCVRIAVAINEFGQWAAWGRWDMRDESNMNEANGNVGQDGPQACYFVEVEIPVPSYELLAATIASEVKVVNHKEPVKEEKK